MRPHGKVFNCSSSLFETQGALRTSIGHAIWFGKFTPVRQDHLVFVQSLLQTLYSLSIYYTLTGVYPAYIAGMLGSHYIDERFYISHVYIAKSTFAILGLLLQKAAEFKIGTSTFDSNTKETFTFSRLFHLRNYVWGCDTIISSSLCWRIDELWASFLHTFSEFIWENPSEMFVGLGGI